MSNIYILSNELCDFCNVPHGSKMHIKQIVRIVEDYIKDNKLYDYLNANIRCIYFNDTLKKIFSNIITDDYTIQFINKYFIDELIRYEKEYFKNINEENYKLIVKDSKNRHDQFKIYTHNFNDIDMYLEMSGHLTPVLKSETHTLLNEISHKIEHVKSLVSYNDDAENHLEEVNKLLKELEDMYHNK